MAIVHWINGAGGSWNTKTNWDTQQVPTSSDDVSIDASGTYTVAVSSPGVANSLTISSGETVEIDGEHGAVGDFARAEHECGLLDAGDNGAAVEDAVARDCDETAARCDERSAHDGVGAKVDVVAGADGLDLAAIAVARIVHRSIEDFKAAGAGCLKEATVGERDMVDFESVSAVGIDHARGLVGQRQVAAIAEDFARANDQPLEDRQQADDDGNDCAAIGRRHDGAGRRREEREPWQGRLRHHNRQVQQLHFRHQDKQQEGIEP
jgi:hypothetical protein